MADVLTESQIEELVLRRLIAVQADERTTFMELGAGQGCQSLRFLSLHAASPRKLPTPQCVLVEAYPPHLPILRENLRGHPCQIVPGAVAQQSGRVRFLAEWGGVRGTDFWGGKITGDGQLEVDAYTLSDIVCLTGLERITFIHMDIQGEEEKIVGQCVDFITRGLLDHVYVGTHGRWRHEAVRDALRTHLHVQIDAPPDSLTNTPFGEVKTRDGILFCSNDLRLSA